MSPYSDPRWQRLRLEAMERDGFKCVAFGDDCSTLHVHHKRYCGDPWLSPLSDLQTLCEDCHTKLGPHPTGGAWYSGGVIVHREDFNRCSQCGVEIETPEGIGAYEHDRCTNLGKVWCNECCDKEITLLDEERNPF